MPLYLDRHDVPGTEAKDVAEAHVRDLEIQDKFNVRYVTYWFDPHAGTAFCLAEAPSKEAAETVHREAHGLVASSIIEVDPGMVDAFLGKIKEPQAGEPWEETAFRTILFTDIVGSTSLTQQLGDIHAMQALRSHDRLVRDCLTAHGGREVKHMGDGIMASFTSASRAVECSIAIQRSVSDRNASGAQPEFELRVGMSAGEPVTSNGDLFGTAVQLAARISSEAPPGGILVSGTVRDLCMGRDFPFSARGDFMAKGFEEPVRVYEVNWQG